jgi:hypothetical protein
MEEVVMVEEVTSAVIAGLSLDFVHKPRPSHPRHKLYKQSKGLLNTEMTKSRERM